MQVLLKHHVSHYYFRHANRDFTFVCPTEILAFNDALPQFKALNASVLG